MFNKIMLIVIAFQLILSIRILTMIPVRGPQTGFLFGDPGDGLSWGSALGINVGCPF
jgi:hypothetical protein